VSSVTTRNVLAFTSVVELGTGAVVIIAPAFVVRLLLGLAVSADGALLARCFGIALLSLALACWPGERVDGTASAFRGMLAYNALIALYLGYLGAFENVDGVLLWPAVVLHAGIAALLPWTVHGRRD
jgi:hypothetical protein